MKSIVGRLFYIIINQFNFANLYVLLLTYNTYLHLIGGDGVFVTQFISVLNVFVSVYCLIKIQNHCLGNIYINNLKRILILFSVYGIFLILTGDVHITSLSGYVTVKPYWYLMEIYGSILPIFSIYYFAIRNYFRKETLILWLFVFMLLIPITFVKSADAIGNDITSIFTANRTSNIGYAVVAILPAISLFNRRLILQFVVFAYCLVFSLICMKRGPILICITCLLVYLIYIFGKVNNKKKILIIISGSLLSYLALSFFMNMAGNNAYFLSRIEDTLDGGSSGRDALYSSIFDYYINKSNIFQKLLGMGAYGSLKIGNNLAHNDWLEILIGQGVLGVLLYARYWFSLYVKVKRNIAYQEIFLSMVMFFIIYFLKTIFSMSYSYISIFSSLFFGYYLALSDQKRRWVLNENCVKYE